MPTHWQKWRQHTALAKGGLSLVLVLCGLAIGAWQLWSDVRSYTFASATAQSHGLKFGSGSSRRGRTVELSYSFRDAEGRDHTGDQLNGYARAYAGVFAQASLERWYASWAERPTVYYDPANPSSNRAAIGLTAGLSALTLPVLLIAATWAVMRRRENARYASGPQRRYSSVAAAGGAFGVLAFGAGVQVIYFTPAWVEHGWIVHGALLVGAVAGMVIAVRLSRRETGRWVSGLGEDRRRIERERTTMGG